MARKKHEYAQMFRLPVGRLQDNPRQTGFYGEIEIGEAARILAEGKQPRLVLVKEEKKGKRFTLISGGVVAAAARALGQPLLECLVLPEGLDEPLRVLEKLEEEEDLNPWLLSDALLAVKKGCRWTQEQLAGALGRKRDYVAAGLVLQQVTPPVRKFLSKQGEDFRVSTRHLRYVARLPPEEQMGAAKKIISQQISSKQLEKERKTGFLSRPKQKLIRVRGLKKLKTDLSPQTLKEWRKYHRQLSTDLKRIDQQEKIQLQRAKEHLVQARALQKTTVEEAKLKRLELTAELKMVKNYLLRVGG